MKLLIVLLSISITTLAQKPDNDGEGFGGAGGGSFRGLEIVKRIPASTSFYNKEIPIVEADSLADAKNKCSKIDGQIVGSQSLPGLNQHCFTYFCSKSLSEGLNGNYIATYGHCSEPQKIENVVSKEVAETSCKSKKGFIYSSLTSFKNGLECNVYRCSTDEQSDEMSQFISQYKSCVPHVKEREEQIKSLVVSKDKKIIHLNGKKYTIVPISTKRDVSSKPTPLNNATNQ